MIQISVEFILYPRMDSNQAPPASISQVLGLQVFTISGPNVLLHRVGHVWMWLKFCGYNCKILKQFTNTACESLKGNMMHSRDNHRTRPSGLMDWRYSWGLALTPPLLLGDRILAGFEFIV